MEILIIAAQDKALSMHYYRRNMKEPNDSTCRMCCKAEGHIKHTVTGCITLALSEYSNRHNHLAGYIYWTICKHRGLQVTDKRCGHVPERIINVNVTTVMWDVPAITDRTILANRADILLHDKKEKTCLPIDIALPDVSKANTKETEKLNKYKNLEIDVNSMWKVRTKIVPVITGALGTIKKALDQNHQLLPGHWSATELQKIVLTSTAQIIRKVLG